MAFNAPSGGIFGGIKSKLGFGDNAQDGYADEYYDDYGEFDDYDSYDGYDEYASDDGYDDRGFSARRGGASDSDLGYTTRNSYDRPFNPRHAPQSYYTSDDYDRISNGSYGYGRDDSLNLVSYNDSKFATPLPESLMRDPLPDRRPTPAVSSFAPTGGIFDEQVAPAVDQPAGNTYQIRDASSAYASPSAPASYPEVDAVFAQADPASFAHSGIFAAQLAENAEQMTIPGFQAANASAVAPETVQFPAAGGFDPYAAYSAMDTGSYLTPRSVKVIEPLSYSDVEMVAKHLRAGDAVVLTLRSTTDELAKRMLDFSFGAASMVNASVDCIAPKVFAFAAGDSLDESELAVLRNQGII